MDFTRSRRDKDPSNSTVPVPVHGCLLRLERPGECRSYLVHAKFHKYTDAKAAVCLQAMSEGVGSWIRTIAEQFKHQVTRHIKTLVTERMLPVLVETYRLYCKDDELPFNFTKMNDSTFTVSAIGIANLIVLLSTAWAASITITRALAGRSDESRTYSVPMEFSSTNNAKIMLVYQAVEKGLVDFMRFGDQSPPSDYVLFWTECRSTASKRTKDSQKRKGAPEGGSAWSRQGKKPRTGDLDLQRPKDTSRRRNRDTYYSSDRQSGHWDYRSNSRSSDKSYYPSRGRSREADRYSGHQSTDARYPSESMRSAASVHPSSQWSQGSTDARSAPYTTVQSGRASGYSSMSTSDNAHRSTNGWQHPPHYANSSATQDMWYNRQH